MEVERPIDELNQRELLILLNHKVDELKKNFHTADKQIDDLKLKVNTLETINRERAMMYGSLSSVIMSLIIEAIKHFFLK